VRAPGGDARHLIGGRFCSSSPLLAFAASHAGLCRLVWGIWCWHAHACAACTGMRMHAPLCDMRCGRRMEEGGLQKERWLAVGA
jgi:hypothetical protein